MFLTEGWKQFTAEIDEAIKAINVASIESADEFWKQKGRLQILSQIAGYENMTLAAEAMEEADNA